MSTDEDNFYLKFYVNTKNWRILATENTLSFEQVPLLSPKTTVCYGFKTSFVIGQFLFEERGQAGSVTCNVNGKVRRLFCSTPPFQNFNSIYLHVDSFLCKMEFIQMLKIQWSSCSSCISKMIVLLVAICQQPGSQDQLIVISCSGVI